MPHLVARKPLPDEKPTRARMRRRKPVKRDMLQIRLRRSGVKRTRVVPAMNEKRIHQIFVVSVLFKGAHALIEIVGGLALYLTSTATIINWINRFSQGELTEDPNDITAREKLASVLAVDLGKVDLGIDQLRLLIEMPETLDEQKAKWLAQIAAWEFKLKNNEAKYEELLKELIHTYPQTAQAFAAQRHLFLLDQKRPLPVDR